MTFGDFSIRPSALRSGVGWIAGVGRRAIDSLRDLRDYLCDPLRTSGRVIHALILRESKVRYGGRSAGYVWALLVPAALLTALLVVFTILDRTSPAGRYLAVFFLMGIIPVRLWRGMMVRGAGAIRSNIRLMAYPQVRPFEIITARVVLEVGTMLLVTICFVVVLAAFFNIPLSAWSKTPSKILAAGLGLTFYCYSSAMLSAQLGRVTMLWGDITPIVGRLAFFTSGVFFTLQSVPEEVRKYVLLNPLAHLIEWQRDAAIPGFASDLYDPLYPIIVSVVMLFIGLLMNWLIRISSFEDE